MLQIFSSPDKIIVVSLDFINIFPNIDNERGMEAVRSLLDSRSLKNPSTECIMQGLEICWLSNNSRFTNKLLTHCKQMVLKLKHQTNALILIYQLFILTRLLIKRELHNFMNAYIAMTIWCCGVEMSKS